jgi:hypothetical protein
MSCKLITFAHNPRPIEIYFQSFVLSAAPKCWLITHLDLLEVPDPSRRRSSASVHGAHAGPTLIGTTYEGAREFDIDKRICTVDT